MARVISFSLTSASIQKAKAEIDAYRKSIPAKTDELCRQIAERIRSYAEEGFASAVSDTAINRPDKPASVDVSVEVRGNSIYAVVASGEDAVWAEFGAGVYYNGSAGTSPHPKGAELGYVIGGYGKGKGTRQVWGYFDDSGLVLTRGTPASMPLYNALVRARSEIASVAREVFSR